MEIIIIVFDGDISLESIINHIQAMPNEHWYSDVLHRHQIKSYDKSWLSRKKNRLKGIKPPGTCKFTKG